MTPPTLPLGVDSGDQTPEVQIDISWGKYSQSTNWWQVGWLVDWSVSWLVG